MSRHIMYTTRVMSNDFKGWGIARARSRFSELLESAAREPQYLYNRGRRVGVVVSPEDYERFRRLEAAHQRSLYDAFAELRDLCREQGYELDVEPRRDRPNPFAETGEPDEPAR